MARYIDADALIEFIDMGHYRNPLELCYSEQYVVDMIESRPTADVVELVRCKDCRYWQKYQEGHYPNELCPWDKNETTDEDDYCSAARLAKTKKGRELLDGKEVTE